MKFKCLDCGHVWEGDRNTTECPYGCGDNIQEVKDFPRWIIYVLGGLGLFLLLMLIIRSCSNNSIIAELSADETSGFVYVNIEDKKPSTLRSEYDVVISSDNGEFNRLHFDGSKSRVAQSINDLEYEQRYYFNVVKKNRDKVDCQWVNKKNWYERPAPPKQPEIECSVTADCKQGNFTITVSVKAGTPNRYWLDDQLQESPVFENVMPKKGKYLVRAEDEVNHLFSEPFEVYCTQEKIRVFRVTAAEIQHQFDLISERGTSVGDAMEKISRGDDVKLTKPIDECNTIEAALNYARAQRIKYKVAVSISSEECRDRITSITLTR